MDETVLLAKLPQQFLHKILWFSPAKDDDSNNFSFLAELRADLRSEHDVCSWLKSFEENTNTKWIKARTHPHIGSGRRPRLLCRKDLLCQHSNLHKSPTACVRRKRFRGYDCKARLTIRIKVNTQKSRRNDPLVAEFPGIIHMDFIHSHPLDSALPLSFLRMAPEVKEAFLSYFESGAKPAVAIQLHRSRLREDCDSEEDWETLSANASKNPRSKTVDYLYREWKRNQAPLPVPNFQNTEDVTLKVEDEEEVDVCQNEVVVVDEEEEETGMEAATSALQEVWAEWSDASSRPALAEFIRRLRSVRSSEAFNQFLSNSVLDQPAEHRPRRRPKVYFPNEELLEPFSDQS